MHGKILEKHDDEFKPGAIGIKASLPIEQLIFEDDQGNRIRLRNVKTKEIMLASGDTGRMTYRGETVYAFERDR